MTLLWSCLRMCGSIFTTGNYASKHRKTKQEKKENTHQVHVIFWEGLKQFGNSFSSWLCSPAPNLDVFFKLDFLTFLFQLCDHNFFSVPSFGGGPAVNHLYMCAICQVEIEALAKRRKTEIDTFIKVGDDGLRSCMCLLLGCGILTEQLCPLACSWTKSFRLRRLPLSSCALACSGSGNGSPSSKAKTMVGSHIRDRLTKTKETNKKFIFLFKTL